MHRTWRERSGERPPTWPGHAMTRHSGCQGSVLQGLRSGWSVGGLLLSWKRGGWRGWSEFSGRSRGLERFSCAASAGGVRSECRTVRAAARGGCAGGVSAGERRGGMAEAQRVPLSRRPVSANEWAAPFLRLGCAGPVSESFVRIDGRSWSGVRQQPVVERCEPPLETNGRPERPENPRPSSGDRNRTAESHLRCHAERHFRVLDRMIRPLFARKFR